MTWVPQAHEQGQDDCAAQQSNAEKGRWTYLAKRQSGPIQNRICGKRDKGEQTEGKQTHKSGLACLLRPAKSRPRQLFHLIEQPMEGICSVGPFPVFAIVIMAL